MKENIKYISLVTLIYLTSNVIMIINPGFFWDDWCMISEEGRNSLLTGVGSQYLISAYDFLFKLTSNPPLFFHSMVAIFEIFTFISFYFILLRFNFNKKLAFISMILFAILPYNQSKILICCFPYILGLFFFVLSSFIFLINYYKKNILIRCINLSLYFLAFILLPSTLLIMLFFILLTVFYFEGISNFRFNTILKKVLYKFDFLLLPFLFWVFRKLYLMPIGIYEHTGYREFKFKSILFSPIILINSFSTEVLSLPSILDSSFSFLLILFIVPLYLFFKKLNIEKIYFKNSLLFVGIVLFTLGVLPYLFVGLIPTFSSYASRHQILLKFGVVFLSLFMYSRIKSSIFRNGLLAYFILISFFHTIHTQIQFQKSWLKQEALKTFFFDNQDRINGKQILVIDNTKQYNEFKHFYSPYVYTGILKVVLNNESTFAMDIENRPFVFNKNDYTTKVTYHIRDFKSSNYFNSLLVIDLGDILLTKINVLQLSFYYYTNKTKFHLKSKRLLKLEFSQCNLFN